LAAGVIAPTSGVITNLADSTWPHPSHTHVQTLTLEADGQDDFLTLPDITNAEYSFEQKLKRIERCAVHGLGGAAFSTAKKIQRALAHDSPSLIVNAVECEPGIHCDDALMQNHADHIVQACDALCAWLNLPSAMLAIEDDKSCAVDKLALSVQHQQSCVQIIQLSAVYPSGAESTLVQRLTGITVSQGQPAANAGVLCLNVATVLAIQKAISGQFPVERVVSVTTQQLHQSVNIQARFGTSIKAVSDFATTLHPAIEQSLNDNPHDVYVGGPLSGFQTSLDNAPVMASTNALLVGAAPTKKEPSACIRCTDCATVCPVNLLPQELYSAAAANDLETVQRYSLDSCILCGCCDLVCPANIPLTPWFQYSKDALRQHRVEEKNAVDAKQRSEQRTAREETRAAGKARAEAKRREVAAHRKQSTQDIKAALERVKRKRPSS